jgi:glucosamine--fructose-6-phosphate aminotransferase (isomerizing)
MGAPLLASRLPDGALFASDLQAILPYCKDIIFVPNGTYFHADQKEFSFYSKDTQKKISLQSEHIEWSAERVAKEGYEHYMLKEIHQQPIVTADTLSGRLPEAPGQGFNWDILQDPSKGDVKSHEKIWSQVKRLYLIGCGTSYHASMVGKYFFERWARIPVEVDLASEFRYRGPILEPDSLVGVISQSGETADTLAAIRMANEMGTPTFSIVNVPGSSIMREATFCYPTKAGPEVGVASTKAFTAQVTVLSLLALDAARIRAKLDPKLSAEHIQSLARLPHYMEKVLAHADEYVKFGASLKDKRTILFLGRGTMYPIALEGALKLIEITYRHAEGYAAGELKHGPLALVDEGLAAVVLAPTDELLPKTLSNLEEIKSRKGYIIGIGQEGNTEFSSLCNHYVPMPEASWSLNPMI